MSMISLYYLAVAAEAAIILLVYSHFCSLFLEIVEISHQRIVLVTFNRLTVNDEWQRPECFIQYIYLFYFYTLQR